MNSSTSASAPPSPPVVVVGRLVGDPGERSPVAMRVERRGGTYKLTLPQDPPFVVAAKDLLSAITEAQRAYEAVPWYRRWRLKPLCVSTDIGDLLVSARSATVQLAFPLTFTGSRQVYSRSGVVGVIACAVEACVSFRQDRLLSALARADVAADSSGQHARLVSTDYAGMTELLAG